MPAVAVVSGFGGAVAAAAATLAAEAARQAAGSLDTQAVVNILTAVGGVATAVLAATAKRRDARAGQLEELVQERNRLRDKYDAAVGYLYSLRRLLRDHDVEPPPVPDEVRDE